MLWSWGRFRARVRAILHLDEEPSRLAASMAVGVFIGITPFFFFHTLLAVLVALVFRLNVAATITGAWVNLPWFAPFVYGFCLKLGEVLLSGNASLAWSPGDLVRAAAAYRNVSPAALWRMLWDMLFVASKPLFVGTTLVGVVLGVVTYFVTLEAILNVRRLRHRAHSASRDGSSSAREPKR